MNLRRRSFMWLTGEDDERFVAALTASMVSAYREYHDAAPRHVRTVLQGRNVVATVMGDTADAVGAAIADVEDGAIRLGRRGAFQDAMQDQMVAEAQSLAGRRIATFASESRSNPRVDIELIEFFAEHELDSTAHRAEMLAAARGLVRTRGREAVTVAAIVDAADVSREQFYAVFKSRSACLSALDDADGDA